MSRQLSAFISVNRFGFGRLDLKFMIGAFSRLASVKCSDHKMKRKPAAAREEDQPLQI